MYWGQPFRSADRRAEALAHNRPAPSVCGSPSALLTLTAGGERMRQATSTHIGRPVAILIDGDVVTAPVLTGPISSAAVISGDYTMGQAEKIRHGIRVR